MHITTVLTGEFVSPTLNQILADPLLLFVFKYGTVFGLAAGVMLATALYALLAGYVAGKAFEDGVKAARSGWRGTNMH